MIPGVKIIDDILKGLPDNARLRAELAKLSAEVEQRDALIQKLQSELRDARAEIQRLSPSGLEESMGVFWKRTKTGFEEFPYCKECDHHPAMHPFAMRFYVCSKGHSVSIYVKPPSA